MLFNSPIYIGNGGTLRRLQASDDNGPVWHDAAYFAPGLWFYHLTSEKRDARRVEAFPPSLIPSRSITIRRHSPFRTRSIHAARSRAIGRKVVFSDSRTEKVFPSSVNAAR